MSKVREFEPMVRIKLAQIHKMIYNYDKSYFTIKKIPLTIEQKKERAEFF